MKNILLGEIIKQRRTDRKMTQSELAAGICSITTISRIESGERVPDYDNLQKILQRLGLDDDLLYGLRSQTEMRISTLQDEIQSACIRFQRTLDEDRDLLRQQTVEKLAELAELTRENDHLTQQFAIHARLILGKENGEPYKAAEKLEALLNAIRLTVPRFDIEKINDFIYYFNEIKIINQIALAYSDAGEHGTANDIFRQLLKYIETHNQDIRRSAGYLPLVAHNYARELTLSRRYEEAIRICEKGWAASVRHMYLEFLGGIFHVMAECYHHLGDESASAAMFRQAHTFYWSTGDQEGLALIKAAARKYGSIALDDTRLVPFPREGSSW